MPKKAQMEKLDEIPAITGSATAEDPWKRIAAGIILQAVRDVVYGRNLSTEQDRVEAATFLTDQSVRSWSDAWELEVPWNRVYETIGEF